MYNLKYYNIITLPQNATNTDKLSVCVGPDMKTSPWEEIWKKLSFQWPVMMLSVYGRSKHTEKSMFEEKTQTVDLASFWQVWTTFVGRSISAAAQDFIVLMLSDKVFLHRATSFTHHGTQTWSWLICLHVRRLSADWMNRVNINIEPEASPCLRLLTCWTAYQHLRKELPVTHTVKKHAQTQKQALKRLLIKAEIWVQLLKP